MSIIYDTTSIGTRLAEIEEAKGGEPLRSKFKCLTCRDTGRVLKSTGQWTLCRDCNQPVEMLVPAPAPKKGRCKPLPAPNWRTFNDDEDIAF